MTVSPPCSCRTFSGGGDPPAGASASGKQLNPVRLHSVLTPSDHPSPTAPNSLPSSVSSGPVIRLRLHQNSKDTRKPSLDLLTLPADPCVPLS